MITVTFLGESYECTTALKGSNYIHLLDDMGCMIASFDGVSDFSGFEISGGEWCVPKSESECKVAVIREDGTITEGGHVCKDLLTGKYLTQMEYDALSDEEKNRENFVYIIKDEVFTKDISDATATFTEASERVNIESGEKIGAIFGKIKKWFSSLGALAFKSTVAAGDYSVGSIKNADISSNALISISKINGLSSRLSAIENHIGSEQTISVGNGRFVKFSPSANSLYVIWADETTFLLYVHNLSEESYTSSANGLHCSYVPDLSSMPSAPMNRGFVFSDILDNSTVIVRKIV